MNVATLKTVTQFVFLVVLASSVFGCGRSSTNVAGQVIVYCALDREFSEKVLQEFSAATGLKVIPKFDTEATKSVGLFQDLVHEASQPRCDVYWNNEIINTIRLQQQGL